MTGFEATDGIQPQRNIRHFRLHRKKQRGYIWAFVAMFILVGFLCINTYSLIQSYEAMKGKLNEAYGMIHSEKQERLKIEIADDELLKQYEVFKEEYKQLMEHYESVSRGSDDMAKQISALKQQNSELKKQVKELVDDNVALQNSLKMAASVGVQPQNFSIFEGLLPRDTLNRGKYVGKFIGTAYTPSAEECGNDKGITKSGTPIMPGISIAVDNRYWPFGTVFYIKGLGYTVAMDTGSAIKGKYRFDFSVFDKNFARQLGKRNWEVYLVKQGTGKVKNTKL